jgi:5-methylcytosine-specific restriction enzyme A
MTTWPPAGGSGWGGRRFLPGDWKARRAAVLKRDPLCQLNLKGCTIRSTQADHIIPVAEGGTHEVETNLQGVCKPCHDEKAKAEAARGRARWRAAQPTAKRSAEPHPGLTQTAPHPPPPPGGQRPNVIGTPGHACESGSPRFGVLEPSGGPLWP